MPLHLVTPVDRAQDARADSDSLDLPIKGWRSHAADLCYIVLRGSTFLASSYLMALGLPLLFFLLISGGDAGVWPGPRGLEGRCYSRRLTMCQP